MVIFYAKLVVFCRAYLRAFILTQIPAPQASAHPDHKGNFAALLTSAVPAPHGASQIEAVIIGEYMPVVVVESPAKAKTINKYLGANYTVLASFGHVRDLPPKDGSVDTENDFAMLWQVGADMLFAVGRHFP